MCGGVALHAATVEAGDTPPWTAELTLLDRAPMLDVRNRVPISDFSGSDALH
eukprot:m.1158600 g.1158600  ORF g.1158600 m.1158600 type:complete len:52 (-) comp24500_c0_seq17:4434-4589(-)